MSSRYFTKISSNSNNTGFIYIAVGFLIIWLISCVATYYNRLNDINDRSSSSLLKPNEQKQIIKAIPAITISSSSYSSEEYEDFKVDAKGFWVGLGSTQGHIFDSKLAASLVSFFKREKVSSVLELGAGMGQYTRALQSSGLFTSCYDGNPNTQELTEGLCGIIDLSKPINLARHDWVLSLEVGEHIPKEFEDTFISNMDKGNERGIVLSWAVEGQGGRGHVNTRNNSYLRGILENKGYSRDVSTETNLRAAAGYDWFKDTIMVYRKNAQLENHEPFPKSLRKIERKQTFSLFNS